jgi:hypothetical protein
MDEILNKLVESEILTDETKNALVESVKGIVEEAKQQAIEEGRAQGEADAKAAFAVKYMEDKEALIESVDTLVRELLTAEIEELREDIERFRDLEAEAAASLATEKAKLAENVKSQMAELVETLDGFLEARLTEEFNELRESIEDVRRVEFGRKMFETFETIFKDRYFDASGVGAQIEAVNAQLAEAQSKLAEAQTRLDEQSRELKMSKVLESLTGQPREIMEALLESIPTEKLDEAYERYIPRVLHESTKSESKQKESVVPAPVLAEGKDEAVVVETVVVTGDTETVIEEGSKVDAVAIKPETANMLKRLAGITN